MNELEVALAQRHQAERAGIVQFLKNTTDKPKYVTAASAKHMLGIGQDDQPGFEKFGP